MDLISVSLTLSCVYPRWVLSRRKWLVVRGPGCYLEEAVLDGSDLVARRLYFTLGEQGMDWADGMGRMTGTRRSSTALQIGKGEESWGYGRVGSTAAETGMEASLSTLARQIWARLVSRPPSLSPSFGSCLADG
ncbi:uncharacterized protein L203_103255 [Cryptococcus depauperatus CBS 7841]|uniref:Uncharacterized protein n=1 Tax=Cryptococcus depauperatus CBS 7841 TaxID=1295531 RepID=A0AAJ8JT98_9TREE